MFKIDFKSEYEQEALAYKPKTPFFKLFADERMVAQSFISAVSKKAFDTADSYLSRLLKTGFVMDYDQIGDIFDGDVRRVKLFAVRNLKLPHNIRPCSTFLDGKTGGILHVYTVYEPDRTSGWKICGIERE